MIKNGPRWYSRELGPKGREKQRGRQEWKVKKVGRKETKSRQSVQRGTGQSETTEKRLQDPLRGKRAGARKSKCKGQEDVED